MEELRCIENLRMKLNKFLVIFCLFFATNSYSKLRILDWEQTSILKDYGQEIEVKVKLKAEDLPTTYYYNKWTFYFGEKALINVLEAKALPPSRYKSYFGDNKLTIEFDRLANNKEITLQFKYQLLDKNNVKYIKRNWVQIPKFCEGANGVLKVKIDNGMDLYSVHDIFNYNYNDNFYIWTGTVPKNGIAELFEMTLKEGKWLVSTIIDISSKGESLNGLELEIPNNFIGGNNTILNYNVSTTQGSSNDIITVGKDKIIARFIKYNNTNGFVRIDAKIKNNYNNFYWLNNFDINDTLKINNDYISTYNTLIFNINNEDKTNLPIHIKIAKWVHKNIKYDKSFVGRDLSSKDILLIKRGVCEHYAILYQDLLRSIGIPAKTVSGISYDFDKNKFENHAWVMVNYNSQWLPIDPTWGIYSGKLPISHIFLYNNIKNSVKYSTSKNIDDITISIKNEALFLEE